MNKKESQREFERELYIFGEAQDFKISDDITVKLRFLSYKEYLLNMGHLSMIGQNVLHLYHQYRKMIDKKDTKLLRELDELKEANLYDIVLQSPDLMSSYLMILELKLSSYEKDEIEEILPLLFGSRDVFMEMRRLVMDMEMLVESEVSPNPEVQRGIDMSREIKLKNNENSTGVADILTSIVAGTAISFKDLQNMTVIQVNSLFQRIGAFKNYDTTTLFATVSADVKIESWSKKIDLYEQEKSNIDKKEFDKNYGSLLK